MGKVAEKKKKKGRPSLLDLQKRTLKEQQDQDHHQNHHHNSISHFKFGSPPSVLRRSTRRNPNSDEICTENEQEEDDEELSGKRREKKLKLVLKLPLKKKDSVDDDLSGSEEDNNRKKRKIDGVKDGSGFSDGQGPMPSFGTKTLQGSQLNSGPSTPLPDKKLLLFVLDRLQKKDTYGVFSEPVDPKELPDYHEIVEHPMDFGTVRKKLDSGAYGSLEQFEKDVFLICSNAMQYNSPDTIYFRQARSIQELAKKSFQNLRQDSDDNEPEPKVVRRGRPPTKNLKKPVGRPPLERVASGFSPDATPAPRGENTNWSNHDLRKGATLSEKSGLSHISRNSDIFTGWMADNKFDRNDDSTGSLFKGNSVKNGKKPFVLDENRRNTYKQSHPLSGGQEPSVLTTFDGERKQLMAVGLLSEYGYARSLARFAANLGPVAWNIASKKIEKSLPAAVKFGPGWVGENDVIQQRPLVTPSPSSDRLSQSPFTVAVNSFPSTTQCLVESKVDKLSDVVEGDNSTERAVPSTHPTLDGHSNMPISAGSMPSLFVSNKYPEPNTGKAESSKGLNSHCGFNVLNSSVDSIRPMPPFAVQRGPVIQPSMNGFNGTYGFNLPGQLVKLQNAGRPVGFNFNSSQPLDPSSRTNTDSVHLPTGNNLNPQDPRFNENANPTKSEAPKSVLQTRPSWEGLSPQQKPDSEFSQQQKPNLVPPDLNVRFQSPGSPSSSLVGSTQPDLALQL